jgi:MFS transporter, FHS family, L-fucose permease
MAAQSKQSAALTSPGYLIPFITVTALFFIFGFITNLNMALVPHLRSIFIFPMAWAMLAESAFFLAYFVFSSPTSKLIETIGYKRTMVVSLFIQVVGCLLFVPAAKMVSFPLFLTAVFVVGAGVTALQTSANPYVSILGPERAPHPADPGAGLQLHRRHHRSADCRRVYPYRSDKLARKAALPTRCAGRTSPSPRAADAGLAVAFCTCRTLTEPHSGPARRRSGAEPQHLELRAHGAGALGIFFYVGVEVGLASIAVNYFKTQGMSTAKTASFLVSLYWFGALVGRLLGSWIMTKVKSGKAAGHLRLCRGRADRRSPCLPRAR